LIHEALGPHPASVTMQNALYCRQPDTSALECIGLMQPLKHTKQLIYVLHVKTDAVVPDENHQLTPVSVGRVNLTALETRFTSASLSIERSP
jgi:hypothetical protein